MATDLTLHLPDQPGELARVGEILGRAGVNIDGLCAVTAGGGTAEVHVLVADATADAFAALGAAEVQVVAETEVLVIEVEDRPGVLGDVSRRLADAGVNLTLSYLATGTRLVIAADDLAAAKSAIA